MSCSHAQVIQTHCKLIYSGLHRFETNVRRKTSNETWSPLPTAPVLDLYHSPSTETCVPMPRLPLLQVARDCGMLPLALSMVGTLAKDQPLDPASWRLLHEKLSVKHNKFLDMQNGKLFYAIDVSLRSLPSNQQEQLQLMAVMASGVVATSEMLASLWDQVGEIQTFCARSSLPTGHIRFCDAPASAILFRRNSPHPSLTAHIFRCRTENYADSLNLLSRI